MTSYVRGWKNSSVPPFLRKPHGPKGSALRKFFAFLGSVLGTVLFWAWRMVKKFMRIRGIWKKLALAVIFAGIVGFIFFGLTFAYYSFNLPDPNRLAQRAPVESTKILDREGKILYELYDEEKRTLIPFAEIPKHVKDATVAIEDKNFYHHKGISLMGIFRSVVINVLTLSKSQGGSTITQQFVRNSVLTLEKSWTRKFKEIALSLQLERKYSKDEILQLYLNEIPYGSNAYGVEAASQTFFGKSAREVTILEAAYLAAMPQAPSYYSPYGLHREVLDGRARTVLDAMADQGYITKQQRDEAKNQTAEFRIIGRGILAPHFVLYVQDLLAQKYGDISLRRDGLKVTTTLDLDLQQEAERIVKEHVETNEKKYNMHNGSLVAVDPKTGQILVMVGSRDYFNEDHDGAVNIATRPLQPGSSFKPYVYATAFKKVMNPATMLMEVTTNFGEYGGSVYTPGNYDGKNYGPVSIRKALQGSLNIPAVKTVLLTGIEDSIDTAEQMGITTLADRSRFGPSIVLGGAEVKLLEHTAAYGVFAAGGTKHDTIAILKIEDKDGEVIEEYQESRGDEVLDPQVAYQITHVLSDNDSRAFIFGQNNRLTLPGRRVAAKTGTTQEYRDAWTVGYTPSLVAGVWMGNNDHSKMAGGASGSLVAATVWNEFMRFALAGKPAEDFARPEGLTEIAVDTVSGKLPTQHTPATRTEIFTSFNAPTDYDNVHVPVTVNGSTQVYTIFHSEKPDDPAWEDPVRAWAAAAGYAYPPDESFIQQPNQVSPVEIKINAPEKVSSTPWTVSVDIQSSEQIREVRFLLDGQLLATVEQQPYQHTSSATRTDGTHQLTVQAVTSGGRLSQKSQNIIFAMGVSALIISPVENQNLNFPANLILEASQDAAETSVIFYSRSAAGSESQIPGTITKRKIGGIYQYTLGWGASDKPASGSYSLYGKIAESPSREITVKIQ